MTAATPSVILAKLAGLRAELADLAFLLERRGRLDAADVTMMISGRIAELGEEIAPTRPAGESASVSVEGVRKEAGQSLSPWARQSCCPLSSD